MDLYNQYEGPMDDQMLADLLNYQGQYPQEYMTAKYGQPQEAMSAPQATYNPTGPGWSRNAEGTPTLTLTGDPNAPAEFQGFGKYSSPADFAARNPAGFAKLNPQLANPATAIADFAKYNPSVSIEQAKQMFDYEKSRPRGAESAVDVMRRNGNNMDQALRELQVGSMGNTTAQAAYDEQLKRRVQERQLLKGPTATPHLTEVVDPQNPGQMLRIDASAYQGGGLGSPGVVGVSGKEPGAIVRDQKTNLVLEKKRLGQQEFSDELDNVQGLYDKLNELKALPSTQRGALSNLTSSMQASGLGQLAGKAIGSDEQRLRDEISSAKFRLLQAMKNATGMSAQQMNSNVELQTMLGSLGDPSKSYEANTGVIEQMRNRYGGNARDAAAPTEQRAVPANSADYQETLFNAKKAIARNPAAREAILQKMRVSGYDTKGL